MKIKKIKVGVITLSLVLVIVLGGCTVNNKPLSTQTLTPITTTSKKPIQGITVNDIKFQILDATLLNDNIKAEVDDLISNKGYYYWLDENNIFTLLIAMGEKTTGGYAIEVMSIEDNEGKTVVLVKETGPEKDQMVTQAITYPYIIVTMQGVTDQFRISNTHNEIYEFIDLN